MSNFHSRIMNIQPNKNYSVDTYSCGHKDARHAAAEIASEADVKIATLELLIKSMTKEKANEWQDISTAPKYVEIDLWHPENGMMVGEYTSLDSLLTEREIDDSNISEENQFEDDWWVQSRDGLIRASNYGIPTKWKPRIEPGGKDEPLEA